MPKHETHELRRDISMRVVLLLFAALLVWWLGLHRAGTTDETKMLWGASYQIITLLGGIWGLFIAASWGGLKSVMGRSILAFSLGLLFQTFGQSVFSYYNIVAHVEIPYPSLADIGYFGSIPLYIYGALMLGRASGVTISLKSFTSKFQAVLIPLIMLSLSYFFFLRGYEADWSDPVRLFLDFGYPLGQAIYVSLAFLVFLLSQKTLGGIMKHRVLFILLALVVQYLADYNFLYQALAGSWGLSGYGDVIYLVAYLLMTIGLIQLKPKFIHAST